MSRKCNQGGYNSPNRSRSNHNSTKIDSIETFATGKSSRKLIEELREAKFQYEKETGKALVKREIGKRF